MSLCCPRDTLHVTALSLIFAFACAQARVILAQLKLAKKMELSATTIRRFYLGWKVGITRVITNSVSCAHQSFACSSRVRILRTSFV